MNIYRCSLNPLASNTHFCFSSYFSDEGIEYNMLRLPIASTDFSTRIYSYDDYRNDTDLDNFKLAKEDYEYKVIIKIIKYSFLLLKFY